MPFVVDLPNWTCNLAKGGKVCMGLTTPPIKGSEPWCKLFVTPYLCSCHLNRATIFETVTQLGEGKVFKGLTTAVIQGVGFLCLQYLEDIPLYANTDVRMNWCWKQTGKSQLSNIVILSLMLLSNLIFTPTDRVWIQQYQPSLCNCVTMYIHVTI